MSLEKNSDTYFGGDEAPKLVNYLIRRSELWFQTIVGNMYLDKVRRAWNANHGIYYLSGHEITFGGESGELVNLPVNHWRNIAQNMLSMVTATRPSFQARAVNTDLKSQIQTTLANGLLEYYMREKRMEVELKKAVEYAIVMGSGFIKMEWNATTGEIYDYQKGEPTPVEGEDGEITYESSDLPMYQGDVEFTTLSVYDVVFDTTKETPKQDWQLCRTFKNKYDLAAKYPEYAEQIKGLQTKSDMQANRIALNPYDETVDIPVYEFFHKATESLPEGRYVLYLSDDIILIDTPLPYRGLPIFRISPSDILGTPYGYTTMFDLLPIQDAINALHSTILTNQHTFGVQNVVVNRDCGLTMTEIVGGMNLIEINPGTEAPRGVNFTNTPAEIFNYLSQLEKAMEAVSGINSVARGNPDPKQNLRSGNALALVQSQALQFISGLQQSYIQLIEDVGTNLVRLLQDFAYAPRIAHIVGKSNMTSMREFKGEDISSINRVIVDVGNALAQTTAGRLEMAEQLIQMGMINTPEEYLSIINTGKLEVMTEGQNKELQLIRSENENLVEARIPFQAILTEAHNLHIKEHKSVLADPILKNDADLVQRVLAHIQEHIDILSNPANANILMQLGQTPIQPAPPMPAPGAGGAPAQGQASSNPGDLITNPQAQSVSAQDQGIKQPNPANPPAPFQDVPQTGAELFAKNTAG